MIEDFRKIGEMILKDFEGNSEIKKKKFILEKLSSKPKITYTLTAEDKTNYEKAMKKVIINLDTKNKRIDLITERDLREEDINLIFPPQSPRGKKIDFNTNSLKYHVENTIPDLIRYIDEKMESRERFSKFRNILKKINEEFYKKGKLNFDLISKKENCSDFEELLLTRLGISKREYNDYNAFFLYIDGKSIESQDFFEDYLNIKYHQLIGQFFEGKKLISEEKESHLSTKKTKITKNVSFLTKFYMTHEEKPVFFENTDISNTYKAFTVNQETFEQLLLGTDYVYKNLRQNLLGVSCLIIPKSDLFISKLRKNTEKIKNSFENLKEKGYKKEERKVQEISYHETKNWKFDLMFYEKDQSAFNVFRIVNDLSYFNISEIANNIKEINKEIKNMKIKSLENYHFNINSIWKVYYQWLKFGKSNDDRKIYRREMLDLIETIFRKRKIKKRRLFKKIIYNLKENYHNSKNNDKKNNKEVDMWLFFDTINYLKFLSYLGIMENERAIQQRDLFTRDISNEELKKYFSLNSELFSLENEKGIERQGLVILGYFVNKIVYAQLKKNPKRSKTFVEKINFDGIKKEDIKKFLPKVVDYLEMYKKDIIYKEDTLFAEMQDRLNYIEKSTLTKEEIVYHILLGNFLGKWIGIKRGEEKTENENNKNEEKLEEVEVKNGN